MASRRDGRDDCRRARGDLARRRRRRKGNGHDRAEAARYRSGRSVVATLLSSHRSSSQMGYERMVLCTSSDVVLAIDSLLDDCTTTIPQENTYLIIPRRERHAGVRESRPSAQRFLETCGSLQYVQHPAASVEARIVAVVSRPLGTCLKQSSAATAADLSKAQQIWGSLNWRRSEDYCFHGLAKRGSFRNAGSVSDSRNAMTSSFSLPDSANPIISRSFRGLLRPSPASDSPCAIERPPAA